MGRASNLGGRIQQGECSSSSSTETNYNNSSSCLTTDLRLGLTISSSHHTWQNYNHLFVKVNMEGIPIGRKLDLMTHDGYQTLVSSLSHMFNVPILCPGVKYKNTSQPYHILTYEDEDGDWMLVGDVPWELFLKSVKKLKITTEDDCS